MTPFDDLPAAKPTAADPFSDLPDVGTPNKGQAPQSSGLSSAFDDIKQTAGGGMGSLTVFGRSAQDSLVSSMAGYLRSNEMENRAKMNSLDSEFQADPTKFAQDPKTSLGYQAFAQRAENWRGLADKVATFESGQTPQEVSEHPAAGFLGSVSGSMVPNLASLLLAKRAPVTAGSISTATSYVMGKGGAEQQAEQDGAKTPEELSKQGELGGVFEAASELGPVGHAVASAAKGALSTLKDYAKVGAEEALQEGFSNLAQDISANYWLDYKKHFDDWKQYGLNMLGGLIGGTAMKGATDVGGFFFGQDSRKPGTEKLPEPLKIEDALSGKVPDSLIPFASGLMQAQQSGDPAQIAAATKALHTAIDAHALTPESSTPEELAAAIKAAPLMPPSLRSQVEQARSVSEKFPTAGNVTLDQVDKLGADQNVGTRRVLSDLRYYMMARGMKNISADEARAFVQHAELPIQTKVSETSADAGGMLEVAMRPAVRLDENMDDLAHATLTNAGEGKLRLVGLISPALNGEQTVRPADDGQPHTVVAQALWDKQQELRQLYSFNWQSQALTQLRLTLAQRSNTNNPIREIFIPSAVVQKENLMPTLERSFKGLFTFNQNTADVTLSIPTWHGTGHFFSKFDDSKVGTGENTHQEGWGIYIPENWQVGKVYANWSQTWNGSTLVSPDGKRYISKPWDELISRKIPLEHLTWGTKNGQTITGVKNLEGDRMLVKFSGGSSMELARGELGAKSVTELQRAGYKHGPEGVIYATNVKADKSKMIQWYAPGDQQPENLWNVLERPDVKAWLQTTGIDTARLRHMTGSTIYQQFVYDASAEESPLRKWAEKNRPQLVAEIQNNPDRLALRQKLASKFLEANGVPGIIYQDRNSHEAAQTIDGQQQDFDPEEMDHLSGTRNMVLFSDASVEIEQMFPGGKAIDNKFIQDWRALPSTIRDILGIFNDEFGNQLGYHLDLREQVKQRILKQINETLTGAHKARVQTLVNTAAAVKTKWSLPYEIRLLDNAKSFERVLGMPVPAGASGAFWQGRVYVFGDKVHTAKDVERVILHETVGEAGIRGLLGAKSDPIFQIIYKLDKRVQTAANGLMQRGMSQSIAVAEVLSKLSENTDQMRTVSGLSRMAASAKLWLRANGFVKLSGGWSSNDTIYLLQAARNYRGTADLPGPFFSSIGADNDLPPGLSDLHESLQDEGLVRFNKLYKLAAGLEQMARGNQNNPFVQGYTQLVREAHWLKAKWAGRIENRIKELQKLDKKFPGALDRVFKHALDTAVASRELGRRFTPEQLAQRMQAAGLSEHEAAVYLRIDQDFSEALVQMRDVALENVRDRQMAQRSNPETSTQMIRKLDEEYQAVTDIFTSMQNRNYFPLSRFGEYLTSVMATGDGVHDGVPFKEGDVLWSAAHEKEKDQQKEYTELQQEYSRLVQQGLARVNFGKRAEYGQTGGHIPPQLEDILRNKLVLSPEQSAMLAEVFMDMAPSKAFAKRLQKAKNTPGWSQDGPRAYADYFLRYSTYLANAKYNEKQQAVLNDMAHAASGAANPNQWMDLRNWLQKHKDYMRNPDNSLGWLRSIVTIWHLGLNPKSAWVNLTQLPLVTVPYLGQRYGMRAAKEMLNPNSWFAVAAHVGKVLDTIAAEPSKIGDPEHTRVLGEGADEVLFEMQNRQLLDQGLAVHMANWADGAAASKLVGTKRAALSDAAMFLFQGVEKLNRRLTGMAAFKLEMQKRGRTWSQLADGEKAEVKDLVAAAIRDTSFEYATYNRPAMMRGKAGAAFIFKSYALQSMFNIVQDKQKWGYILALFAAAGLMGLPGAEDAQDLLDGLRGYAGKLGLDSLAYTEPLNVTAAKLLQKYLPQGTVDLLLHGIGRDYGLGPVHALTAVGVPIPHVDITSSISQGDIVPGTKLFRELGVGTGDKGRLAVAAAGDLFGAAGAFNTNILQALANPANMAAAAPQVWKNLAAAYELAVGNGPVRANGTRMGIVSMTPQEERMAALLQAFGFRTTDVAKAKEAEYGLTETRVYWNARRSNVVDQFESARDGSADARAQAVETWRSYNARAPLPMRLTRDNIARALRERAVGQARQSALGTPDLRAAPMARDFYEATGLDTSALPGARITPPSTPGSE